MRLAALTTLALLATSGAAIAHDSFVIDRTQAQQQRRIEHGRLTGQLTRREYKHLLAEQRDIAAMERRAEADGYLSEREYRAIRAAQNAAARHIYGEMHDGQISLWRRWQYRYR